MPLYLYQQCPLCFPRFALQYPGRVSPPVSSRWKPSFKSFSFSSHVPPISATSSSNEELLQTLVDFEAQEEESRNHLPAVRTYENDLFRLTLIGAVDHDQAITAAAADGGYAADEHLSAALSTMAIETVYPGSNSHSTVSTRLVSFFPLFKVGEVVSLFVCKMILPSFNSFCRPER